MCVVCVRACACVRACVCVCTRACVCARACARVRVNYEHVVVVVAVVAFFGQLWFGWFCLLFYV